MGHGTPEGARWVPMLQVLNGALESIKAGNGSFGAALVFSESVGQGAVGWHVKLCLIFLRSIQSGIITWNCRNRLVRWWTQILERVLWYVHFTERYQTIDRHTSQFLVLWLRAFAELDVPSITKSITVGQWSALKQNHQHVRSQTPTTSFTHSTQSTFSKFSILSTAKYWPGV